MNASGVVVIIAGVWVLAQVLKGDLFGRLKVFS
jgi:hypothetical protein